MLSLCQTSPRLSLYSPFFSMLILLLFLNCLKKMFKKRRYLKSVEHSRRRLFSICVIEAIHFQHRLWTNKYKRSKSDAIKAYTERNLIKIQLKTLGKNNSPVVIQCKPLEFKLLQHFKTFLVRARFSYLWSQIRCS